MKHTSHPRRAPDTFAGFLGGALIILGSVTLLMNFALIPQLPLWKLWPLACVWLGIWKMSLTWLLLGAFVQAHYFGVLPFDWSLIWPGLVILVGVQLLGIGRRKRQLAAEYGDSQSRTVEDAHPGSLQRVDIVMGGQSDRYEDREFSGLQIRCALAGYELDLRGARVQDAEVVLDVDVTMGGIEVRVPKEWRVHIEGSAFLGAIEDNTSSRNGTGPTLLVRGRVMMGGVELRN